MFFLKWELGQFSAIVISAIKRWVNKAFKLLTKSFSIYFAEMTVGAARLIFNFISKTVSWHGKQNK